MLLYAFLPLKITWRIGCMLSCASLLPWQVHFTVLFQQQSGSLDEPHFEFFVIANSTNDEDSRSQGDNIAVKIVDVDVDTNLTLYG